MKINFSKISTIDEAAERLKQYVTNSNSKKINSNEITNTVAKNIVSKCYFYNSYNDIEKNLSPEAPQLNQLSEFQIAKLKEYQFQILSSSFNVSEKLAELLWMAMSPYEELYTTNRTLKIGQIGRYSIPWGDPNEYFEDTKDLEVYLYVEAVKCNRCNGSGKKTPHIISQDLDMEEPPVYSNGICDTCSGEGILHKEIKKLNQIRLSKKELTLQRKYEDYYNKLEDEVRYTKNSPSMEQSPHYVNRTFDDDWGTDSEMDNFPIDDPDRD